MDTSNFTIRFKIVFSIVVFTCLCLCLLQHNAHAQQSLNADAGQDTVICGGINGHAGEVIDTIYIGGSPAATGGDGNYSFHWDIYPKPYYPYPSSTTFKNFASDFLSDTTTANPYLIMTPPDVLDENLKFVLTVTDGSTEAQDTVLLRSVEYSIVLGNHAIYVMPGDTVSATSQGFHGGEPPYTLDWGEADYLIGDRYDYDIDFDSTFSSRKIVIPSNVSHVFPYLKITDTNGCTQVIGTWEMFFVEISDVEEISTNHQLSVYPNPAHRFVFLEWEYTGEPELMVYNMKGKLCDVHTEKTSSNAMKIDFNGFASGVYYIYLQTEAGSFTERIVLTGE